MSTRASLDTDLMGFLYAFLPAGALSSKPLPYERGVCLWHDQRTASTTHDARQLQRNLPDLGCRGGARHLRWLKPNNEMNCIYNPHLMALPML